MVRGPLDSTYSDEVDAGDDVTEVLTALATAGIEIKLGQIPDDQRPRIRDLTQSQIATLKARKLDILRVLLAKEMVAEAEQIRRSWMSADRRTASTGRRYGDLLFSARAILPPGYDWDLVTYEGPEGKTCWSHQLAYDRNGRRLEGVTYHVEEAELLLDEFKGGDRPHVEEQMQMEVAS